MAIGDDATAAGFPLVASTDDVREGYNQHNETRDLLARRQPIADLPAALAAKLTRTNAQYNADFAARDSQIAAKANASNVVPKSGGDFTGTLGVAGRLFVGDHPGATFSYVVCYINGDNQISGGVSSSRYKKSIVRDTQIPDVFAAPFSAYVMRADPGGVVRYGYIAEDLDKNAGTKGFVVYDSEGRPESYDMIGLLLAQVEQLNRRVAALESGNG